jgi:hypothetical protein
LQKFGNESAQRVLPSSDFFDRSLPLKKKLLKRFGIFYIFYLFSVHFHIVFFLTNKYTSYVCIRKITGWQHSTSSPNVPLCIGLADAIKFVASMH